MHLLVLLRIKERLDISFDISEVPEIEHNFSRIGGPRNSILSLEPWKAEDGIENDVLDRLRDIVKHLRLNICLRLVVGVVLKVMINDFRVEFFKGFVFEDIGNLHFS